VPNGADPRFAEGRPQAFAQLAGERNFVLYAGRIEPRKNQFGFLQAMQGTNVPIVILGDVVPGHESYLDACRRIAGPEVRFLDRLQHDDPLLASAYAACGCLALTSWYETPGLVALEAGMLGTPLVLTDRGCTQEYFGDLARYVSPDDPAAIRREVQAALVRGCDPALAELVREKYTWQAAAEATRQAYEKVLGRKIPTTVTTD
jgi:glycosyltransferase involved in cell wall biosynthesis